MHDILGMPGRKREIIRKRASSIEADPFILFGGRGRNRTLDQLIKSQLLCQLSYTPLFHLIRCVARPAGLEPATYGFEARRSIQLSYGRHLKVFCLTGIRFLVNPNPEKWLDMLKIIS